jgi:hypothetical protein
MKKAMKGAAIVALATLGFGLSACGSESTDADATATMDAAELTAAAIDNEAATVGAPIEAMPTDMATGTEPAPTVTPVP